MVNKTVYILLAALLVLYILIAPYISQSLINPINRKCSTDDDCVLKDTDCNRCDCGDTGAVNKNWNKFCPFGESPPTCYCAEMDLLIEYRPFCKDGFCQAKEVPRCDVICSRRMNITGKQWTSYYTEKFDMTLKQVKQYCGC